MWLRRAAISGCSSSQRPNAAESASKPSASGCGAVTVICVSFHVELALRVLGGPCRAPAGPLFHLLGSGYRPCVQVGFHLGAGGQPEPREPLVSRLLLLAVGGLHLVRGPASGRDALAAKRLAPAAGWLGGGHHAAASALRSSPSTGSFSSPAILIMRARLMGFRLPSMFLSEADRMPSRAANCSSSILSRALRSWRMRVPSWRMATLVSVMRKL